MRSSEEIQKDATLLTYYAEKKQYSEFVELASSINEDMFTCMSLLTHSFPTIEKVSKMKVIALLSSILSIVVGVTFFTLLIVGATYIQHPTIQLGVNFLIFSFIGPYLWFKIKDGFIFYSNIRKVASHEKALISKLGYYLEIADLLKPLHEYALMQIGIWDTKGEYKIEQTQNTESISKEAYDRIMDDLQETETESKE